MTLSQKTFYIFASLTLVSVLLAAGLFYFLYAEAQMHFITKALFQVEHQLHEVERERFHLIDEANDNGYQSFRLHVAAAKQDLWNFQRDKAISDTDIAIQLRTILFQLDKYEHAAIELYEKYREDRRLKQRLRYIFFNIPQLLRPKDAPTAGLSLFSRIADYHKTLEAVFSSGSFDSFPDARKQAKAIEALTTAPKVHATIAEADRISQEIYINILAIRDRKAFLATTSKHFHDSVRDSLATIGAVIDRDRTLYYRATCVVSVLAVLLALFFWIRVQNYFKQFLKSQKQIIEAIRSGTSEVRTDFTSQDELGELTGILKQLAQEKEAMENSLRQARTVAESANATKNEFLANMSHEIRTPLNGIQGMLQLLQLTPQNTEQSEYTQAAIQSTHRLSRLLADILDLSRVEAGKLEIRQAPFDIEPFLYSLEMLFSSAARQKGLQLHIQTDPLVPRRLVGDSARLQQILGNFVGNAIKFTEKGRIEVQASVLPLRIPGRVRLLFTVKDTGIGIPDALMERLFEPFVQAETRYQRQYQGAGLGLSIARRLTSLMGGTLAVASEQGAGTCCYLSIPFGLPNGDEKAVAPHARPGKPECSSTELRILLAEDDIITQLTMTKLLGRLGHRTTTAENGRRALDILQQEHFDLVFMDIQMPVMDGIETTRAIRAGDAGRNNSTIPIVAVTAYAMSGDQETFLAAGMDDYMPKPVELKLLRSMLVKFCRMTAAD